MCNKKTQQDIYVHTYPVVVNTLRSTELLSDCPHIDLNDLGLSVLFYIHRGYDDQGNRLRVKLTTDLVKKFSICIPPISEAVTNSNRMFKPRAVNGREILGNCSDSPEMFILMNKDGVSGASIILDNFFLKNLSDEDFYIIPSSTEELFILPLTADISAADVSRINSQEEFVPKEIFLSSHLFKYSHEEDKVLVV